MNHPSFPNGMQQSMMPNQNLMGRPNPQQFKRFLVEELRKQVAPPGWQQTFRLEHRIEFIIQICTQLKLVKPDMSDERGLQVAREFETGKYLASPNEEAYRNACKSKLNEITQARQNAANSASQRFAQMQGMQGMQGIQAIPGQQQMFQQPMPNGGQFPQALNLPPQPQGIMHPQNMNMAQMQQQQQQVQQQQQQLQQRQQLQQQQQQQQQQMARMASLQQNYNNMRPQNVPTPQPHLPVYMQGFTDAERQMVANRAQNNAMNMTEEQRIQIAKRVESLPDHQKATLESGGMNSIIGYLQSEAARVFRQNRQRNALALQQQQQQQQQQQNPAFAAPNAGTPQPGFAGQNALQQQANMSQPKGINPQQIANQPLGMNVQQQGQMAANGNINQQILAQQQEALRHQQAGHMVVPGNPGSGGNPAPGGNPGPGGTPAGVQATSQPQQQQQFGQPNAAWQMPTQGVFSQSGQQLWNNNNNQGRQIAQTSAQQATPNLATAGQPQLQGQMGGLDGNGSMRQGQQGTVAQLPTLNRPMEPPGQAGPSPRPGQQPNQVGQRNGPMGVNAQNQPGNGQPENPTRLTQEQIHHIVKMLPPNMKEQLRNVPEANRQKAIYQIASQWQRQRALTAQGGNGMAQGAQQGIPPPQQSVHPGAIPPNANVPGRMIGGQAVDGTAPVPGAPLQIGPNQQTPGQTGQPNQLQPLNEEQARMMDRVEVPQQLRGPNTPLQIVPANLRLWGEMKQFVVQNQSRLPPNILPALNQRQAFHFHSQQAQRGQLQGQGAQRQLNVIGNRPGPGGPMQAVPQANMAGATARPGGMPPIRQIQATPQDIQNVRNNLPNAQSLSDEQVRFMIVNKKMQQLQQRLTEMQTDPQAQSPQSQMQATHMQEVLRVTKQQQEQQQRLLANQVRNPGPNTSLQNQPSQPPQNKPGPAQNRGGVGRAPPANMTPAPVEKEKGKQQTNGRAANQSNQSNLKNLKRTNTSDDVVEIADPKLNKTVNAGKPAQPNSLGNAMPGLTPEKFNTLTDDQKRQFMAQRQQIANAQKQQAQDGQARQGPPNAQAVQSQQATRRVAELTAEVKASMQPRPPQNMNASVRNSMIKKLQEVKGFGPVKAIGPKIPMALAILFMFNRNEEQVKELIRLYLLLQGQVRGADWTPVDRFTISPSELDHVLAKLKDLMLFVMKQKSLQGGAAGAAGVRAPPNQQATATSSGQSQPTTVAPAQPLTMESLQKQQDEIQRQRATSLQKGQSGTSKTPSAPTTSQPPPGALGFGHQSPHGEATYFNTTLTRDKLQLPTAKKRKPNNQPSPAGTPGQSAPTPGAQSSPPTKIESPKISRTAPPPRLRCTVEGCTTQATFADPKELEKHVADAHPPKEEEITDPLAYCLESLRVVLNLDSNGKSKAADTPAPSNGAPPMKKSASMQSQTAGIKQQPASTPMSRNATGTGPSPPNNSNTSNLLRTPQASNNVKTPSSDINKPSTAKATPSSNNKLSTTAATPSSEGAVPDPWATAKVPKSWFSSVFSDVADLNHPVSSDFLVDWLERNPFNTAADPGTTDSSDASVNKTSPHSSDISAEGELNINLTAAGGQDGNGGPAGSDDEWIPSDWLDLGAEGALEASLLEPVLDMDWETQFENEAEVGNGEAVGKRGVVNEDDVVSDEFLKIYKPEELLEREKRGGRR